MSLDAAQRVAYVDVGALTVLGLGGGAFALKAVDYRIFREEGGVGSGFLPFTVGLVVMVLAIVLVVQRTRAPSTAAESVTGEAEQNQDDLDLLGRSADQRLHNLWAVGALLLLAMLFIPVLGLVGALAVLTVVISGAVEKRPWPAAAAIGCGTGLGLWVVFGLLLRVPLPMGVFA